MKLTTASLIRLLDLMPGNVLACAVEGHQLRCIHCTRSLPPLLGYSAEEFAAITDPATLVFEEDLPLLRQKVRERLDADDTPTENFLFRLVHKSLGFIWVRLVLNKIGDVEGETFCIANITDATKEMLTSATLMDISDRCVCVIERHAKRLLYANSLFYGMIGSTPAQAMGKHCYELLCQAEGAATNDHCPCFETLHADTPLEMVNPTDGKTYHLTGREITWGEYDACIFYASDVTQARLNRALLEASTRRFNIALENSDLMIWEYDIINHRCINSEKAQRDYNVPLIIENYPESLFTTGYTPPETVAQIKDVQRRLENGETGFSVERRTITQEGRSVWQKVDYSLECDENGKPLRAIVCGLDITAQKELEQKYKEQVEYRNNLAQKAMFSISLDLDADCVTDYTCSEPLLEETAAGVASASEFLARFYAYLQTEQDAVYSAHHHTVDSLKGGYLLGQSQYGLAYRSLRLNKYLEVNLTVAQNPTSKHTDAFFIVQDVTGNSMMYDSLTGLYNREKTFLECRKMMAEHPGDTLVMVHFDIQRFRLYNSFFGESEGDRLLKYIADMFRTLYTTHHYGVFGRIEADVFLLFFPYHESVIGWNEEYIHKQLTAYRSDFQITGNCGIYIVRDRHLSVEAIFNRATIAAKNNANRQLQPIAYFDEKMEAMLQQEQEILKDMKRAVEQQQFEVYLQPKYVLLTGEALGAEALVRWNHPEHGIILPGAFIPIFEANGFITTLDRYMWEHVCILLRRWLDAGYTPQPISVNMSRVSMYSPQTVSYLAELIQKYDIPPALLNLELTESAYMDAPQEMKQRLLELRAHGFKIMMDDFGSGYSSLNTLRDIPVDYLKVDRVFLASVDQDKRSRLVLSSVVHMATMMGIPVITEGVETEAQKEFLTSIGCDYVQGFLYAKPMPADEYEARFVRRCGRYTEAIAPDTLQSANISIDMDIEVQRFFNQLPYALAFVEYIGTKFSYISANTEFLKAFGMHMDTMDMAQLIEAHVCAEAYEALRGAYQKVAETRGPAECFINWRHTEKRSTYYLVRIQFVGKSAYSTIMTSTFIDLNDLCRRLDHGEIARLENANSYTLPELTDYLHLLNQSFDLARLVRPETTETVTPDGDLCCLNSTEPCYTFWGRTARCENCTSRDCVRTRRNRYKIETRQGGLYLVASHPLRLRTGDGIKSTDIAIETLLRLPPELLHTLSPESGEISVRELHKYKQLSYQDSLTVCYNRRYFNEMKYLPPIKQGAPQDCPLAFVMIDLDGFKRINDSFGHKVGDQILIMTAETLKRNVRPTDSVIRYGGDEFLVVFSNCTAQQLAVQIARLKAALGELRVSAEHDLPVHASFGQSYRKHFDGSLLMVNEMMKEADSHMYKEKRS